MTSSMARMSLSTSTLYPPPGVRFLVFWVTVAGVIVICLYGVEESKLLIKELDDVSRMMMMAILILMAVCRCSRG